MKPPAGGFFVSTIILVVSITGNVLAANLDGPNQARTKPG